MEALPNADLQLRFIVATVHESMRAILAEHRIQLADNLSRRLTPTSSRGPPSLNGEGAKNWLLQIENYHDLVNIPMQDRVADAISYLTG